MNKNVYCVLIGLFIATFALSSCDDKRKGSGRTDTHSSGAISFASDESFSPIIDEEVEIFEHNTPKAKLTPIYTNESEAVKMLLDEKIFLAITSRDLTKNERNILKNKGYKNIRSFP
ncbi:MAG: phosphate-binding protein, partial [Prevotella sp.]|nr:phosphate-binding protein [Prevotella sp.]